MFCVVSGFLPAAAGARHVLQFLIDQKAYQKGLGYVAKMHF